MPEIGLQSFSKNSFRKLLRWHPKKEDPNVMKRQDAKRKEEKREQNCFKCGQSIIEFASEFEFASIKYS